MYVYLEPFHDPSSGSSLGLVLRGRPSKIELESWLPGMFLPQPAMQANLSFFGDDIFLVKL